MSGKNTNIEQKLTAVYAVEPAGRFVNRLEKDLLTGEARARRLPVPMGTRLVWAAVALTVLAGLMLITPQGRAFAQEILHFFTRAGSDTLPAGTPLPVGWVDVTPGVPGPTRTPMAPFADCGEFSLTGPRCSVEQVRARVNFPVEELGTIPTGLHFVGTTGGPDLIVILYATADQNGWLYIIEQPATGSPDQTQVGASAVVETVRIGNVSGEYVLGTFVHAMNEPTINWNQNAGIQTVRWADQGVLFEMGAAQSALMPKEAFVALAATLTTVPVSANLPTATATPRSPVIFNNVLYDLTASQAGEQAGFGLREPGRLPDMLTLAGAAYEPDGRIVRIFYPDWIQPVPGEYKVGLVVSEQPIPGDGSCGLCNFIIATGDTTDALTARSGQVVGQSAVIESVQVAGVPGQYVEGWWSPAGTSATWVNPLPIVKTLRWQANGMAFELRYTGSSLSMADLITIAENMK